MPKKLKPRKAVKIVHLNGDAKHTHYVAVYRSKVMKVIRDIRSGVVSEEDIDKLQNFAQMSLKLMEHSSRKQLHYAWRDTEIKGLIDPEDSDSDVVLDPDKQG